MAACKGIKAVLLYFLVLLVQAYSQSCCKYRYGWPIIDRPRVFSNRASFLDLSNPFPRDCGCIRKIHAYIKQTNSGDYYVRFGIWKKETGFNYRLMSMSRHEITSRASTGLNFTIIPSEEMKLFNGAVFGMTFEQTTGPIAMESAFAGSDVGNFAWVSHAGDLPNVGSVISLINLFNYGIASVALDISNEGEPGPPGIQGPQGQPGQKGEKGGAGPTPVAVNECLATPNLCPVNSRCVDTFTSYECKCNDGYLMDRNNCINDDECARHNGDCEQICIDSIGSYSCRCRPGFQLLANGKSCIDIDECLTGSATCQNNSECINTVSSYECRCTSGFQISSGECININECVIKNGRCQHVCNDNIGSYSCSCNSGYTLNPDMHTCSDVDECASSNPCGSYSVCSNTPGSYRCVCNKGYTMGSLGCVDIDECLVYNGRCNQYCNNSDGSYRCSCHLGYQLMSDGITCRDIDECNVVVGRATCPVHSSCTNTMGSYTCRCEVGYIHNPGGNNLCTDIDECTTRNGGCDQMCLNGDGSFNCSCFAGYTLAPNRRSCHDVNECLSINCAGYCINTPGSYHCLAVDNNDISSNIQFDDNAASFGQSGQFSSPQRLRQMNRTPTNEPHYTLHAEDAYIKQKTAFIIWLTIISLLIAILVVSSMHNCHIHWKQNMDPFHNEGRRSPFKRTRVLRGRPSRRRVKRKPKIISNSTNEVAHPANVC